MELVVKTFDELTTGELYDILKLRVDVFVVEQACPYEEVDGKDRQSVHVYLKDETGIKAYLRVIKAGVAFDDVAIGRVIARERRQGLGTEILQAGINAAKDYYNAVRIVLEAQTYARGLYEKAGFVQTSEEFVEDGIPHIRMMLEL
jgi:Predicted acyltransferase